ncbi:MAG: hypothetical protein AB2421_03855 [Thermotaleaceae bacterium]
MEKHSLTQVRTCKKCKKTISDKSLYDYCPTCFQRIEDVFNRIRDYLEAFPGATAFEMEQELNIPYHVINNFVRDGRLIEIPNDYIHIQCKGCGCLLLSAHYKYCPTCRKKLEEEIEKAKTQLFTSVDGDKAKMHSNHKRNTGR